MGYIYVPNLDRWQHYRDRNPPWIKLHRDMLNDYKFSRLQDASKAHLIQIWLLASQMDNRLPLDPKWIANRINATQSVDLKLLIEEGFLACDSETLAECKQSAIRETETEAKTEAKIPTPDGVGVNGVPFVDIVDLYHSTCCPPLPAVEKLTTQRKAQIRQRWQSDLPTMDHWRRFFEHVKACPFLLGRNDRGWRADIGWLTKEGNFAKIAEGKYEGRR